MHSIYYKKRQINFTITRKKVKNINLRVNSNLEVTVSAPSNVATEYIIEFMEAKAEWIYEKLNYYIKVKPLEVKEKEYIDGELFRYLGRQYRLKLFESPQDRVKYFRGCIHIYTKDLNDLNKKQRLIEDWYKEKSKLILKESLDRMYELIKIYDVDYPTLSIRKMKSRWGTCYPGKSKIIINRNLIKAPKVCIDYVILHELVHFKHMNHKKGFYSLQEKLMPDWKDRKKILDEVINWEL